MDKLTRWQVFVSVADTNSFTKAAEVCHLPRSTVSAAIQQLERQLQVRLFNRTTRSVHLTVEGKQLLERAKKLLADMDDMEQLLLPDARSIRGHLRINAPSRVATRLIAPALPEFFVLYPDIYLELSATDREVELVAEGVDCAIRVGDLADSGLIARKLGDMPVITCASADYLNKHGTPKDLSLLQQHWMVSYFSSSTGQYDALEFTVDGKPATCRLNSKVSIDNADTYIACALAGMGLIQIPAYDVREYLASGKLVQILSQFNAEPMPVNALYPHRQYLSKKLVVFINWMQQVLKQKLENRLPPMPSAHPP